MVGAAYGLLCFWLFALRRNVRLKQALWRPANAVAVGLFYGYLYYRGVGAMAYAIATGVLAFTLWITIGSSGFCPECGHMVFSGGPFEVRDTCQDCGRDLLSEKGNERDEV